MMNYLTVLSVALEAVMIVVLVALLVQSRRNKSMEINLSLLEKNLEKNEKAVREEIARNREENANNSRQLREEIGSLFKNLGDFLLGRITENAALQNRQLETLTLALRDDILFETWSYAPDGWAWLYCLWVLPEAHSSPCASWVRPFRLRNWRRVNAEVGRLLLGPQMPELQGGTGVAGKLCQLCQEPIGYRGPLMPILR